MQEEKLVIKKPAEPKTSVSRPPNWEINIEPRKDGPFEGRFWKEIDSIYRRCLQETGSVPRKGRGISH